MHFMVTVFVAIGTMGSILATGPTHNPASAVKFSEVFFWVWQTGPVILARYFNVTWEKGILFFIILWSLFIGAVIGYSKPKLHRNHKQKA